MRIEYQNVDIAQEEHVILKGVNFQAEAGEFVYQAHPGTTQTAGYRISGFPVAQRPYRTGQSGFRTQSDRMEKEEGTEHTHS